jgi:hypothetical protein
MNWTQVEEQIAEDDRNKLDRKATAADPQIVDGTLEVRDGGGFGFAVLAFGARLCLMSSGGRAHKVHTLWDGF